MKRLLLVIAVTAALLPLFAEKPAAKFETLTGKVVPLADVLAKDGAKLDPDAAPHWLALQAEDGKLYPLVKDAGARMFFADKALLNRPMRLTGRFVSGSSILHVGTVNSLHKGELYEVYYWCDICAIKRGEKMVCECCGAPMELKEQAVKKE